MALISAPHNHAFGLQERLALPLVRRDLKDRYWESRPEPELGTVELRATDTLDVLMAIDLAAAR